MAIKPTTEDPAGVRSKFLVLQQGEIITGISGASGNYQLDDVGVWDVVHSIQIHTNMRTFGAGGGGGTPFQLDAPPNQKVVGFFGRSHAYIDAIGILTRG